MEEEKKEEVVSNEPIEVSEVKEEEKPEDTRKVIYDERRRTLSIVFNYNKVENMKIIENREFNEKGIRDLWNQEMSQKKVLQDRIHNLKDQIGKVESGKQYADYKNKFTELNERQKELKADLIILQDNLNFEKVDSEVEKMRVNLKATEEELKDKNLFLEELKGKAKNLNLQNA